MRQVIVWAITFYKKAISPFLPHGCRFTPSCSTYVLEAVKKYGAFKGSIVGLKRLFRCHPFCPGGSDPLR
ncbi:MAG TPA: membrane protein insertion efficiency factor YidD [Candidatus Omnitrophota bacterium]|nr:membrane protein insertion efficiency factor YidD [Candidatus Omnitrophota bacterium]